jgi:hypothetical protein
MSGRTAVPALVRYSRFAAITVSNVTQYGSFANPPTEDIAAIYVGTNADVVVVGSDGVSVTFKAPPAGTVLPISPLKVTAGTTLLALFW